MCSEGQTAAAAVAAAATVGPIIVAPSTLKGVLAMCATAQSNAPVLIPAAAAAAAAAAGATSACCSSGTPLHVNAAIDSSSNSSSSNSCCTSAVVSALSSPAPPACPFNTCMEAQQQQQQQQQQLAGDAHILLPFAAAALGTQCITNTSNSSSVAVVEFVPAQVAATAAGPNSKGEAPRAPPAAAGVDIDADADDASCEAPAGPAAAAAASAAAAEGAPPGEPSILTELGVSMQSLMRLLTGDCTVESQQPVWMVVNLQGKIKGSYTASKMLEFSRRGTLSSAQLILGIDKDLPYISRQDLGYYRRIDTVLQALHAGSAYTPLTQQAVDTMTQNGQAPTDWQPFVTPVLPTEGSTADATDVACTADDGTAASSSAHAAALAADAQLKWALERLCGCSSPSPAAAAAASAAATPAAAATASTDGTQTGATTVAAAAAAAVDPPALSRASSASVQGLTAALGPEDGSSGSIAAAVAAGGSNGSSSVSNGKEPVWLYINHLGWCRGPFPGEKMVQAHLCGRLPRDTLVVCLNPELPPSLLCMDMAYYFRPFGVLLDNVVNGWRYQPVDWQDVAGRGLIKALQQQQQQQQVPPLPLPLPLPLPAAPQPWTPLVWADKTTEPEPLVNPELLEPPTNIPAVQGQPKGQAGVALCTGSSSSNGAACIKMPRRRRLRQQPAHPNFQQPQQQQQQGLAGHGALQCRQNPPPRPPGASSLQCALRGLGLASAGNADMAPAPGWPAINQQQQQQQGLFAVSCPSSTSSSSQMCSPQQLQTQTPLQHQMLLLQLHDQQQQQQQQQQQDIMGAFGPGTSTLSVQAQGPMLQQQLNVPGVLSLPQQQQQYQQQHQPLAGANWATQQPVGAASYCSDSPQRQHVLLQQALQHSPNVLQQQQYQQQQLLNSGAQTSPHVPVPSFGSPHHAVHSPYTDMQAMNAMNGGISMAMTAIHGWDGMNGAMNGTTMAALSTGMTVVGLDSLQPSMQASAVAAATTNPLLLQLLHLQSQQQQQQYSVQGHAPIYMGMKVIHGLPAVAPAVAGGATPTCMGLVADDMQQQLFMPLQQQQVQLQLQGWPQ